MSIYSDELAHVQVISNCRYSIAQMCTHEDMLAHNLGAQYFDDVMSYNLITTDFMKCLVSAWPTKEDQPRLSWNKKDWDQK